MNEVVAKNAAEAPQAHLQPILQRQSITGRYWNRLKHDALPSGGNRDPQGRHHPASRQLVEAIDLLEPIEGYWAFPGREAIALMRRLLEIEDYRNLALLAGRIVRALSTDAYRRQTITLHGGQDGAGDDEVPRRTEHGLGDVAHGRPYFEVLVVDAMGPNQESALPQGMHHARRPDDPFTYELLVVRLRGRDDRGPHQLQHSDRRHPLQLPLPTPHQVAALQRELLGVGEADFEAVAPSDRGILLSR